jgi:hypothetical protein
MLIRQIGNHKGMVKKWNMGGKIFNTKPKLFKRRNGCQPALA